MHHASMLILESSSRYTAINSRNLFKRLLTIVSNRLKRFPRKVSRMRKITWARIERRRKRDVERWLDRGGGGIVWVGVGLERVTHDSNPFSRDWLFFCRVGAAKSPYLFIAFPRLSNTISLVGVGTGEGYTLLYIRSFFHPPFHPLQQT